MKLTKYGKENIILFNEGEDTASIYTFHAGRESSWHRFAGSILTYAVWKRALIRAVFLCAG